MRTRTWINLHPLATTVLLLPLFAAIGLGSLLINDRYDSGFIAVPLLYSIGLLWIRVSVAKDERPWLMKVCLIALGIRFIASFGLEYLWSSFEGTSDGAAYGPHATAIAQAWQRVGWTSYADVVATPVGAPGYVYFSASVFWLFGANTLYIKLINGLFAVLSAVYTYKLGKHFFGQQVGRLSALATAFMPSMILWTSQNLKDSMVVFLSMWALWLASQGLRRGPFQLLMLGAVIAALATVRIETAIGLAIIIALTFVFQLRSHLVIRALATVIGAIMLGFTLAYSGYGFLGRDFVERTLSVDAINAKREVTAYGGSAVASSGIDDSTVGLITYLPQAATNFLLRPWPWEATGSITQLMTIPESLFIWYPLFGLSLIGLVFCWRTRPLQTSLLWVYILAATVAAAPQYGNLGTAYRHRVQLWPCFFIFAAVGWYAWRDWRVQRRNMQPTPQPKFVREGQ